MTYLFSKKRTGFNYLHGNKLIVNWIEKNCSRFIVGKREILKWWSNKRDWFFFYFKSEKPETSIVSKQKNNYGRLEQQIVITLVNLKKILFS